MCGICGYIGLAHYPADPDLVRRMARRLVHRGPDEEGLWVAGPVALGMRRLQVIDLETGSQPIFNEDRTVVVTFNGEVYNFRPLRRELEQHGHRFATAADTEVIAHAYEEWGDAFVEHLNGMFAIALWDDARRRLLLARDRVGKKPLYYHVAPGGGLIWGSEIKAVLAHPAAPVREPNLIAIDLYLSLQYVPDPLSAFSGIQKLPPAHQLLWEDGRVSLERYWDLEFEPKWDAPAEDLARELRSRLEAAVANRLVCDVPLGVFLSGGVDSSIITALMARASGARVKTFAIGFMEESFNELEHARAVAERYGTEHQEFIVEYHAADVLPQLVEAFDEPFADPSALPTWYLARMTRRHVTVALNGDGGDETHAGYQRYRLDRLAARYVSLPRPLRAMLERGARALPEPTGIAIEKNWIAGLKRLGQVARVSEKASILRWGSYFSEADKDLLYDAPLREARRARAEELLGATFDRAPASDFLDRTLYVDLHHYLPGDLLVKADRMTMAHSLEGRSPFLDYELMEWTARLPVELKAHGRNLKVLLRRSCADLLPDAILRRPKQGFGVPVGAWLRGELAPWAAGLILSDCALGRGLFRPDAVRRLMEEHQAGRHDHGKRLWALLMLELWFQIRIDAGVARRTD